MITFKRLLKKPSQSSFLLGPRGTGKSTWIGESFNSARSYDLLLNAEVLRLSKNPGLIGQELDDLAPGSWVVIDEVQKVPALLDEVHRLIEKKKLKFLLSGSSARKLKKGAANLLAGRAQSLRMFPLVSEEIGHKFEVDKVLEFGMLPMSLTQDDPKAFLKAYAETYLKEEIQAEALTRNLGSFGRFLEVAARQNAQVTNVSNIARDAQVARQTVQGFFEILEDTLLGYWLPAWKLKRSTKQVAHPKFFFFDTGVIRSLGGRLSYACSPEELGHLQETWLLNELRAYMNYRKLDYPIYFWSSHDGVEVDLFFECSKGFVGIEVKYSNRWDKKFGKGLRRLNAEMRKSKLKLYGVFNGPRHLKDEGISVFPIKEFLKSLWSDELFT